MNRLRSFGARTPLRVRLVAAMLALVAVALVVTDVGAYVALRQSLVHRVDDQMTTLRESIVRSAYASALRDRDANGDLPSQYYVQVNGPRGENEGTLAPVYGQSSLPDLPSVTIQEASQRAAQPFTVGSHHGGPDWRCQIFLWQDQPGYSFTVAYSLADIDGTLSRLRLIELVVSSVLLLLLGITGYALVRSSLRPLGEIELAAESVAAGDFSRRVRERDARTEVGRLGRAFNAMVGQVEQAFRARAQSEAEARTSEERMRRFVGDASHELRTPLTSIRGFAELYRQGAVSEPQDVRRVFGRIEDESRRMTGLVEDLLLLARLDQQRPLEQRPVDLAVLASDAVMDASATQPEREIDLQRLDFGGPVAVVGDEGRLRQVLANLVRNALVHTPASAPVHIRVGAVGGSAVLEVADEGPGIDPADAPKVFERFFRTDSSRSRDTGAVQGSGYGLGLSIVAAIVSAHRGRVGLETSPGHGAEFRVELPLAPS
ncbi:two-component system OmpR family sensor kinase [Motilibacter rhizosphaerae]|uniref:histidine kinase n=2 Tax=Motilibacter rhizosphaerae TaxID=598652 RepID=A0A4V2F572_9ACTN|nr:HAMP domain-containing sensor histidine kinase [Motilibacter rhizosphaerae]RZS91809.1 two-component system OmpR family sensor kinase [Motilibacter rhizosphaerae]